MRLKVGDTVVVITGKDKGKKGHVIAVHGEKIVVQGVNMQHKHQKANQKNPSGGIQKHEGPIDASNVMIFDPKVGSGTRVGYKFQTDGTKVRYSKKSGEQI